MASLALIGLLAACQPPPPHLVLTVNRVADGADATIGNGTCEVTPGAGDCSLRAAIQEANAAPSADVITIATGGDLSFATAGPAITDTLTIGGGGVRLHSRLVHTAGTLTLKNFTIRDVTTVGSCGGAVASTGAGLALDHMRITANSSDTSGGGVCASGGLAIVWSRIDGNALAEGASGPGAAFEATGPLTIIGSTVDSNTDPIGAMEGHLGGAGPLTVINSTLYYDGGRIGAATASGQILASDASGTFNAALTASGSMLNCLNGTTITSGGYNARSTGTCGQVAPTDIGGSYAVGPFGDHGGPTPTRQPSVIAPTGSQVSLIDAIPAGTPVLCDGSLPQDQRQLPRATHAGCDIGPVELQTGVRASAQSTLAGPSAWAINASGTVVGSTFAFVGPSPDYVLYTNPATWNPAGSATVLPGIGSAYGVNVAGATVGALLDGLPGTPTVRAWQLAPGAAARIVGPDGSTGDSASDIADDGAVVGNATVGGLATPWWRPAGSPAAITLPAGGGSGSVAEVDQQGHAVGSRTVGGVQLPVRWDLAAGTFTDLALPPGASSGRATAVSNGGIVAGMAGGKAVWWDQAGSVHELEIGETVSDVSAVNDQGVVMVAVSVGAYCRPQYYSASRAYAFDTNTGEAAMVSEDLYVTDINDAGAVVGITHSCSFTNGVQPGAARLQLSWAD